MKHQETGRTVTLVGTYMVGDPQYYREITDLVDDTEKTGGLIQSQGSELADATVLTPLTEQEKQALSAQLPTDEARAADRASLAKSGLVPEFGTLERRPHWRYPDVDKLVQARLVGSADKLPGNRAKFSNKKQPRPSKPQRARTPKQEAKAKRAEANVTRFFLRVPVKLAPFTERLGAKSVFRTALTNRQEQNAALDLLEIPGPANALAIWGAGLLPGIRAALERNGFELTETRWLTAFTKHAPDIPAQPEHATALLKSAGAGRQESPAPE